MLKSESIRDFVVFELDELKARDVRVLDVRDMTSITDLMIVASGTSDRHVQALADTVVQRAKKEGANVLGVEGEQLSEWILVDLGDVVVHLMQPRIRDFYNLEKLWEFTESRRADSG